MAKGQKKKMSAKKFTAIVAPLLAILLAFSIALPVISTSRFDLVLRDIFGEAESSHQGGDSTEGVDSAYYKRDITDSKQLQADEQAYTRRAGAEGFVLLYNRNEDGKGLPVAGGSKLSLFSAST